MLCPSCGTSVGDVVKHCDACAQARRAAQASIAPENASDAPPPPPVRRRQSLEDTVRQPKVYLPIAGGMFVILYLVCILLHPAHHIGLSFLAALIVSLSAVSICAWGQMWVHLFNEHSVLALLTFLLPVGVYRMVIAYPEELMKSFLIHIGTLILAVGLTLSYVNVAHANPWSVLFGMSEAEKTMQQLEREHRLPAGFEQRFQ